MATRRNFLRATMLTGLVGAACVPIQAGHAAALSAMVAKAPPYGVGPAVDGLNGRVDAFGGSMANRDIYGAKGAVTVPLQGQWGAQIDGVVGNFDTRAVGRIGGHLFWRDPSRALLGAYVSHTH
jgi:hypothetical protein